MDQQFETWLHSGETKPFFLVIGRRTYIFLRLPKCPGFDYLFAQGKYWGDGALHIEAFEYAGIYNAADGLIYDGDYITKYVQNLDETLSDRSKDKLLKRFKQDVCAIIERRVAGDRSNLTVQVLTDPQKLREVEHYRQYDVSIEARKLFVYSQTPKDVKFFFNYYPGSWTESALLNYIADPLGYAKREAERYWADNENQERMLSQLFMHDALMEEYEKLVADTGNSLYTIRRIIAAVSSIDAKTLTVTIHKNDQDFTFKTEASSLRHDCQDEYNTWRIIAADRQEFKQRFGKYAGYTPNEIVRITYRGKILYEKGCENP